MKYLLDTCVISELTKAFPSERVVKWISELSEEDLFLSVFTIGEITKGIGKLPPGRRRNLLSDWVNKELSDRFENRVLDFTSEISQVWGKIQAEAELKGKTLSLIDGLIASIAIFHGMVLVTRNITDFEQSGVEIMNPWE